MRSLKSMPSNGRRRAACLLALICLPLLGEEASQPIPEKEPTAAAPTAKKDPSLPIRFEGLLPGNVNLQLEGKFRVEFRIYASPQGGQPVWREEHEARVEKGRIDVELGTKNPIPMSIHESTYKWLGASVSSQREVFPRYPIVNVVYASPREALLAHEKWQAEARDGKKQSAYKSPGEEEPGLPGHSEPSCTWKEALEKARSKGRDLASYQEWYKTLESLPPEKPAEWTGHYEWVLPWVYDTASHGRYNSLFRGRFQGCDYSDLSPDKKYVFREVTRAREPAPERGR